MFPPPSRRQGKGRMYKKAKLAKTKHKRRKDRLKSKLKALKTKKTSA